MDVGDRLKLTGLVAFLSRQPADLARQRIGWEGQMEANRGCGSRCGFGPFASGMALQHP